MIETLSVIEQREVELVGGLIIGVLADDGQVYATLPSLYDALRINIQPQTRRIDRSSVLSAVYTKLAIMASLGEQRRLTGVLRVDRRP